METIKYCILVNRLIGNPEGNLECGSAQPSLFESIFWYIYKNPVENKENVFHNSKIPKNN
jgi:hypothetical protein